MQKFESTTWIDERELDFRFWCKHTFDSIWAATCVVSAQPFVDSVYLGTTHSAPWRWKLCDGHNNMVCHQRNYDIMYPLGSSYGANILAMERLVQSKMLDHFEPKCSFCSRYRPGPLKRHNLAILYICVVLKESHKGTF